MLFEFRISFVKRVNAYEIIDCRKMCVLEHLSQLELQRAHYA